MPYACSLLIGLLQSMSREKAASCRVMTGIGGSAGFSFLFMLSRIQVIERKYPLVSWTIQKWAYAERRY